MINNLPVIEKLLIFPNSDNFYFVQVLQRKKDHPGVMLGGSNNNSRLIRAYYIKSIPHLHLVYEEMTKLAEVFNARVQINLNPRSFRKAGLQLLQKVADQMLNDAFDNIPNAYNSICGNYHKEMDKRWIVDIDQEDIGSIGAIESTICKISSHFEPIEAVIPSKSGFHIISKPFRLDEFQVKFPNIEIHKNNPTNLFIP